MTKDNDTGIPDADFPPLSPTGEQKRSIDPLFEKQCLSELDQIHAIGAVEPITRIMTMNKEWGDVIRIDFSIDHRSDLGFVNRMVCWRQKTGAFGCIYALGQQLAPLSDL